MHLILTFIMTLAMFVGLMLVFRKPLLWYLKIDEILKNQQEILNTLQQKSLDKKKR